MKRILLPSIPSTNDYALELLRREEVAEWTVVQTPNQTRGRGQGSTRWEAEPGSCLTLSVVLYPRFLEPRVEFLLSQAVALGVADCVSVCLKGRAAVPLVKWPNDVLIGERKVAGILIENRISSARLEASVVGIGLNVNQPSFPAHLGRAASLRTETGTSFDTERVLEELLRRLEERYRELSADPESTRRAYLARLYGAGRVLRFAAAGRSFRGSIQGVDEDGRLIVVEAGGQTRWYGVKEIDYSVEEAPPGSPLA